MTKDMDITHNTTAAGAKYTPAVAAEEHKTDWLSITEVYQPYVARMDEYALCYIAGGYFVCRGYANVGDAINHFASWLVTGKLYGYGTYEWIGKIKNPVAKTWCIPGFFEKKHGWGNNGSAFFECKEGTYNTVTYDDAGNQELNAHGAEDWTSDTTFKIVWDASKVEFYTDGGLLATHSTRVPTEPAHFGIENAIFHTGSPASEPFTYIKEASFKEL